VQLIGNAVVTREAPPAQRASEPVLEIRGEFLHAFMDQERVISNKPVILKRGNDVFQGNGLEYDNLRRVLELKGAVRGTLQPHGR
jgi:lipopolysaccharide export system protein LptC